MVLQTNFPIQGKLICKTIPLKISPPKSISGTPQRSDSSMEQTSREMQPCASQEHPTDIHKVRRTTSKPQLCLIPTLALLMRHASTLSRTLAVPLHNLPAHLHPYLAASPDVYVHSQLSSSPQFLCTTSWTSTRAARPRPPHTSSCSPPCLTHPVPLRSRSPDHHMLSSCLCTAHPCTHFVCTSPSPLPQPSPHTLALTTGTWRQQRQQCDNRNRMIAMVLS